MVASGFRTHGGNEAMQTDAKATGGADVDATLTYGNRRQMRMTMAFGLGGMIAGLYILIETGRDSAPAGAALLAVSLGLFLHALFKLTTRERPVLVLAPEGLVWLPISQHIIAWRDIVGVDRVDHEVGSGRRRHTIRDVNVVWVARRYFETHFPRPGFPASAFWDGNFIQRGRTVGIVLFHNMFTGDPAVVNREIAARLEALGGSREAELAGAEEIAPLFGRGGTSNYRSMRRVRLLINAAFAVMICLVMVAWYFDVRLPTLRGWIAEQRQQAREAEIERSLEESRREWEKVDRDVEAMKQQMERDRLEFDRLFGPTPAAPSAPVSE